VRKRMSTSLAVGAVIAVALAVAGCGGGSSSSTAKVNHDPAQAILKQLGLQECTSRQVPSTVFVNPNGASSGASSFAGARSFIVAPDCSKNTSPRTTITAGAFTTHKAIAEAKAEIKKRFPKAGVASFRTVVVDVLGPNAQATADKIVKLLSAGVIEKG